MESFCFDREDEFYDAREELSSAAASSSSDWDSDHSNDPSSSVSSRLRYEVWAEKFGGVLERRRKFMKWMGLGPDSGIEPGSDTDSDSDPPTTTLKPEPEHGAAEIESDAADRVRESSGAVLRTRTPAPPSRSAATPSEPTTTTTTTMTRDSLSAECGSHAATRPVGPARKRVKRSWLRRLGLGTRSADDGPETGSVEVYPYKKRLKELSSLRAGQEIRAHEGSISAMKFSHDGRYLASAGQDAVVRVWEVDETAAAAATADDPLEVEEESAACVIYPPKVFNLSDKPLREFRGHRAEVLDLSWSTDGFLLSSSVDMTVRLWQVGCDQCLRVFCHNNYVTCVDFNPVDDNYFISGSIDGKVRIWEVSRCRVVDYIDVREIVTAVSYRPDGKGGIVGSMTGTCLFYNIEDNRLELDAQICLQEKKKSPGKRITGFKFNPDDPSKVMITSADSLVRVVSGNNVICKFKGLRNGSSQSSASFTSDGKHIVSATEDSNVYVWNYNNQEKKTSSSSRRKSIWASESFPSRNASIAIPWCGPKSDGPDSIPSPAQSRERRRSAGPDGQEPRPGGFLSSSPDCFSIASLLESLPRGTATWPEEKLVGVGPTGASSPAAARSKLRSLRNALQNISGSPHMWGLVIVTAGWDGRIRTFLNYGLPLRI